MIPNKDYDNYFLLKEDSLKCSFYYHLRNKLGDEFLQQNNLRIFSEFNDSKLKGQKVRADIAIVIFNPNKKDYYFGNRVTDIVAIIELKFKGKNVSAEHFLDDIVKTKKYIKDLDIKNCHYYLGFIHENEYEEGTQWIYKNRDLKWANKKVTELFANKIKDGNGNLEFGIIPHK